LKRKGGAIHQTEITIINLYVPDVSTTNLIKHTLKNLKAHIDHNTLAVGDFNSLSQIDRLSKQKIQKEILDLNDNIEQMDLTDVYRIFHPTAQYTFLSAAHGAFSKIDHISGHKASLGKYNKIVITPCILSDHNAIKLKLNKKKQQQKTHK
jgi:endonuclease/exonuclease/phosphatase family metal-dependent hydrolase